WGENDQLGTLNYITPQKIIEAARLVKTGKVINVAIDLRPGTPSWPGRIYKHTMDFIAPSYSPEGGAGGSDDMIIMHQQYSTQWDALPHYFFDGKMYNGYPASRVTVDGTRELSVHSWSARMVSRGVLLDMARLKKVPALERGYIITPTDLEAAAANQNVAIEPGDILLIRTGWIKVMSRWPTPLRANDPFILGEPGLGLQAAKWLKDKMIAAVAMDNMAVEAIPFDPEALLKVTDKGSKAFPLHVEFLVNQGMPIGEIFDFEELAENCASDGVYQFLFVAPPLRIVGGVGSPLSPLAIK
ncbi:MAG: cyclase family protein, partial [Candidatus Tectomicrobia bacterium]|nr:cyclase family protein [Candidatus Tectomicrobia bacterium]